MGTKTVRSPPEPCITDELPIKPKGIVFLDTASGGLTLDREDSIDFLLYVKELESWARIQYEGCK